MKAVGGEYLVFPHFNSVVKMNPINTRIFAVKVNLFPFSGEEGKMTIKFTLFDSVRRPRYSKDLIFPPLAKQGRESILLSSVLLSRKQRKRLASPTSALDQYQMSTKMPMETKLAASCINSPQPEQLSLPFLLVSQLPMAWHPIHLTGSTENTSRVFISPYLHSHCSPCS